MTLICFSLRVRFNIFSYLKTIIIYFFSVYYLYPLPSLWVLVCEYSSSLISGPLYIREIHLLSVIWATNFWWALKTTLITGFFLFVCFFNIVGVIHSTSGFYFSVLRLYHQYSYFSSITGFLYLRRKCRGMSWNIEAVTLTCLLLIGRWWYLRVGRAQNLESANIGLSPVFATYWLYLFNGLLISV